MNFTQLKAAPQRLTCENTWTAAETHRRTAGRYYRRARRDAQRAVNSYTSAARARALARTLTGQYRDDRAADPARWEEVARITVRVGDSYLRASFRATEEAQFYMRLAASYEEMNKS